MLNLLTITALGLCRPLFLRLGKIGSTGQPPPGRRRAVRYKSNRQTAGRDLRKFELKTA